MKISAVQTQLSDSDIISIFNEFVKVEGLSIDKIELNNSIEIYGSFTYKIKLTFDVALEIISVNEGIIKCKFSKLKLSGLGFFRPIRSLVLKFVNSKLQDSGIKADVYKDSLEIDTKIIINQIPYIDLNIDEIYLKGKKINVEVSDIEISLEGKLQKNNKLDLEKKAENNENLVLPIKKKEDLYTKGRKKLVKKFFGKSEIISEYIFMAADISALIYRLLKDERVKIKVKLQISAAIAYIIFPIDIIPEFIPFIGKIDDIAVLFFALNKVVKDVPINIIAENWSGKNDLIIVLKKAIEFISSYTNMENVDKLYTAVSELTKL